MIPTVVGSETVPDAKAASLFLSGLSGPASTTVRRNPALPLAIGLGRGYEPRDRFASEGGQTKSASPPSVHSVYRRIRRTPQYRRRRGIPRQQDRGDEQANRGTPHEVALLWQDRHRAGPACRAAVHFHWKAHYLESV